MTAGRDEKPPLEARIARAAARAIDEKRIVGAVIIVSRDGEIAYRGAHGMDDREAGIAMTTDRIFRYASLTKAIVSVAALAQIDRGLFKLDSPVTEYLPDFRPRLADGSVPPITIRHLLTHTSGLRYRFLEPFGTDYHTSNISDGMDQPDLPFAENLRRIASVPLAFAPGAGWLYSLSTDVLGAIVAKVHGDTLGAAVRHYVTGPLGLVDADFTARDAGRLNIPYADGPDGPVRMGDEHPVTPEGIESALTFVPARILNRSAYHSGGAGMAGTADDYLRFLETLRRGGAPILKPETMAMAAVNQIGDLPRDAPPDLGWRYGFLSSVLADPAQANSPQSPGTMQWGGAYGHSWFIDPTKRLSAVILTNTAFEGVTGRFPADIRDAIYGRTA